MTLSMLKGEHGPLHREVERLAEFVASLERPDAIVLSNALILGVARRLKERTGVPVLCSLQGEAPFVRALPAGSREAVWELMRERARDADGFLAVSATYGREMQEVLGIPSERIHVVHNGIVLDAVGNEVPAHASRKPPTVGYLARLCDDKGLSTLVEAFVLLAESGRVPDVRLLAAGVLLDHDRPLVARLEGRLRAAGLAARARILPDVSRAEKWALLKQMTVFSVPATYGESFGLYLLEALAAGVPVVQPRHGAFPEILEATGGGLLCEPGDPRSLAAALEELLLDPDRGQRLAAQGRGAVARHFTAEHMARRAAAVIEQFTPAAAPR
jgi:glycosyltransferase involved in cell wall biosynthesis